MRRVVGVAFVSWAALARAGNDQAPAPPPPAAPDNDDGLYLLSHPDATWWLSGQANTILQAQPGFHSPYAGDHSFLPDDHHAISFVVTAYGGYEVGPNTAIVLAGESAGGTGYRCQHATDCTSDCCAGTCGVSAIEACARDSDCVAGFLCGPDGLCVSGDEGASCVGGSPCAPGLVCDANHTCSRRPAAGAACNTVSFGGPPACDDEGDICGPSLPGACIAGPSAGTACIGGQRAFDASCDTNNLCQPKPASGEACMVGSLTSPCLAPLHCAGGTSGSVGICTAPAPAACM